MSDTAPLSVGSIYKRRNRLVKVLRLSEFNVVYRHVDCAGRFIPKSKAAVASRWRFREGGNFHPANQLVRGGM